LGLVAVILRAPFWLPVTAVIVAVLIPVIYLLMFYKQLERRTNRKRLGQEPPLRDPAGTLL
jgi:hypothetical protein